MKCPGCGMECWVIVEMPRDSGMHLQECSSLRNEHTRERCQELSGVKRLVEAARKIVAYDETYHNGRTRFDTSIGVGIGGGDLRALRDALQEVTS